MVPVVRRNLMADKVRLLFSVGGVTFAVLLIVVVQSLYQGYAHRIGSFAERVPVDIWIAESDTNGFIYASMIPERREAEVAAVPGVEQVVPVYGRRLRFSTPEGIADAYFLAYDLPPTLAAAAGLELPAPGEITLDRVLAAQTGLEVGDTLTIRGVRLTVSRIADLAGAGVSQFAVISVTDADQVLIVPGYASFLLVRVTPGAPVAEVAATITQSVLVGAAVVGVTVYTATVERTREYGVLKALGASRRDLLRIVLTQSVAVGVAGFLAGVPLAAGVNRLALQLVPRFITLIRWQDLVVVFAAALGMAVLAAVIPIHRVASIDPASVFRA
jgi:putative ABC transport system permease protein